MRLPLILLVVLVAGCSSTQTLTADPADHARAPP
jgi:hypothetical protein